MSFEIRSVATSANVSDLQASVSALLARVGALEAWREALREIEPTVLFLYSGEERRHFGLDRVVDPDRDAGATGGGDQLGGEPLEDDRGTEQRLDDDEDAGPTVPGPAQ